MQNIVAKLVTAAAAVAATFVAKKVIDGGWSFVTGRNVPENPDDPDIDVKEAVAFALFSGALVAVAKLLANRQTAKVVAKTQHRSTEDVASATN